MNFPGSSLLSTKQLTKADLDRLFSITDQMGIIYQDKKKNDLLAGRIMASIFFEPSTRTRFSFESAMLRLGGKVISNADMMTTSSVKKQESLFDSGKVISKFADIIVMRHPVKGSVAELARGSEVPVINGGDGIGEHPTQALLDLYTIQRNMGKIDGLTIGMVGDLKNSRVLHSQCDLFKHYAVKFIFISPPELKMGEEIKAELQKSGHVYQETDNLAEVMPKIDVLSHTRIQEERFSSRQEYEKFKGVYVVNNDLMRSAKEKMIVIHPLPRVDELSPEVDTDSRAKYFEQVENGVKIRMALLALILGGI